MSQDVSLTSLAGLWLQERQLSHFLADNVCPMHLCIFLILTTGMSVGEVMGIQWKDVSIRPQTKTHRRHFI